MRSFTSKPTGDAGDNDDIWSTEGMSFTLDGVEFVCHGAIDGYDLAEFAAPAMDAGANYFDPAAVAALGHLLMAFMGQDTYRAFQAHRRHFRTPPSVITEIIGALMEEVTGRPPGPSPGSQRGPGSTGTTSKAPSRPRARRPAARASGRKTTSRKAKAIPRQVAQLGDFTTAVAPGNGADGPPSKRTVNVGDAARTSVEPLAR